MPDVISSGVPTYRDEVEKSVSTDPSTALGVTEVAALGVTVVATLGVTAGTAWAAYSSLSALDSAQKKGRLRPFFPFSILLARPPFSIARSCIFSINLAKPEPSGGKTVLYKV